jgi:hypothetical protein
MSGSTRQSNVDQFAFGGGFQFGAQRAPIGAASGQLNALLVQACEFTMTLLGDVVNTTVWTRHFHDQAVGGGNFRRRCRASFHDPKQVQCAFLRVRHAARRFRRPCAIWRR